MIIDPEIEYYEIRKYYSAQPEGLENFTAHF